jgi:hypothetical protein
MSAIPVRSWQRKSCPYWLELQGHNCLGVLDSEGKALEDGEHVLSVHVHLPELRCCFGGKREVDGLIRHREEHTPAPPLPLSRSIQAEPVRKDINAAGVQELTPNERLDSVTRKHGRVVDRL